MVAKVGNRSESRSWQKESSQNSLSRRRKESQSMKMLKKCRIKEKIAWIIGNGCGNLMETSKIMLRIIGIRQTEAFHEDKIMKKMVFQLN